jgi:hypothetical protein
MRLFFILLIISFSVRFANAQDVYSVLEKAGIKLKARISQHDFDRFSILTNEESQLLTASQSKIQFKGSEWSVKLSSVPGSGRIVSSDIKVVFRLLKGNSPQSRIAIDFEDQNWTKENYLLMPSAAYNGNRFDYRRISYSPKLLDPRDIGVDKPTIVTDIPKLNFGDGPSKIQERSGGMATPSMGYFNKKSGKGVWILFEQGNAWGDYGVNVEENRNRDKATFSLTSPLVREGYKYRITDNRFPSPDKGADFVAGDSVVFKIRLFTQPCQSIQQLYDQFFLIRKEVGSDILCKNEVTFSQAFKEQELKFNTQNFVKDYGYYSVGMRENFLQDWQIGWTGGMISTYPLLVLGADSTRQNVVRNFNWLFDGGISPSGFFWDSGEKGNKWYGGDIRKPHTKNWHLVRKSGDGLFFVLKQLMAMPFLNIQPEKKWLEKTKGVADAFVKLWKKNKQLGQFIDNVNGEIQVGGSASGAIVPAALVLASRYYKDSVYLAVAKEIGQDYYEKNLKTGVITGGPGDAMQNPDSESSYALIESYMYLFEATKDRKWLVYANDAAKQFSTWVSSYNYKFPASSLFGKLDIKSTGAVWANTQNKHGAPAICTHSGLGLLKLYLATHDTLILSLIQDIAHNLPQYMGTKERPIPGVKNGWVCERVSTTDWLEGIGEITYQSTWAETGLMLTNLEIPGLLIEPEKGKLTCFDQIEANPILSKGKIQKIKLKNPTGISASVRYWISDKNNSIEEGKFQVKMKSFELKAGEEKIFSIKSL